MPWIRGHRGAEAPRKLGARSSGGLSPPDPQPGGLTGPPDLPFFQLLSELGHLGRSLILQICKRELTDGRGVMVFESLMSCRFPSKTAA